MPDFWCNDVLRILFGGTFRVLFRLGPFGPGVLEVVPINSEVNRSQVWAGHSFRRAFYGFLLAKRDRYRLEDGRTLSDYNIQKAISQGGVLTARGLEVTGWSMGQFWG